MWTSLVIHSSLQIVPESVQKSIKKFPKNCPKLLQNWSWWPSWGGLEPSWRQVCPSWRQVGPSWSQDPPKWEPCWRMLDPYWPILAPCWRQAGPRCCQDAAKLGSIWGYVGHLGVMLSHLEAMFRYDAFFPVRKAFCNVK